MSLALGESRKKSSPAFGEACLGNKKNKGIE